MDKAPSKLIFFVLGAVVLTALSLRVYDSIKSRRAVLATATVRGATFTVEIADNDRKKEKGLGYRDSLPEDRGMYFPMGSAQYWVFWMKGMRFPIDIIWLADGKVVGIDASVPVTGDQPLVTYSPPEPADAILELNAGTAAKIGLKKGDALTLDVRTRP